MVIRVDRFFEAHLPVSVAVRAAPAVERTPVPSHRHRSGTAAIGKGCSAGGHIAHDTDGHGHG
jgi:hypothetical protein